MHDIHASILYQHWQKNNFIFICKNKDSEGNFSEHWAYCSPFVSFPDKKCKSRYGQPYVFELYYKVGPIYLSPGTYLHTILIKQFFYESVLLCPLPPPSPHSSAFHSGSSYHNNIKTIPRLLCHIRDLP